MAERLVALDPNFAQILDNNCNYCVGNEGDNSLQQTALDFRGAFYPSESVVVNFIKEKCQNCHAKGMKFGDKIIDTDSCVWR